ncbi:MAG: c-type cytochrome [Acidobacteria bacterium]|nr:c-type cytochrome [Acidobacteriota bacterium]
MRILAAFALSAAACSIPALATVSADARRGEQFFEKQKCNTCHSVGAAVRSSGKAPDLAASADREYTPSGLASRMWNHAPAMWDQMKGMGVALPAVSEQDAADLYAFFYAARYFEKASDAGRGKKAFYDKRCADCHSLVAGGPVLPGPPVASWQTLGDPLALVQRMWNHLGRMQDEAGKRKIAWPQLTSQDLGDILIYLRTVPGAKGTSNAFALPLGANGRQVFESKGCVNCHKGANSLEKRLSNQTLTDIAAEMWNHGPRMKQPGIQLNEDEMRQLVAYLWGNQFFASQGNSARGRKVFETKQCGSCHGKGGAPKIEGRAQFSDITLVSALWKHGPQMLATLKAKNMAWPQLTAGQMSDLVAYLAQPEAK